MAWKVLITKADAEGFWSEVNVESYMTEADIAWHSFINLLFHKINVLLFVFCDVWDIIKCRAWGRAWVRAPLAGSKA